MTPGTIPKATALAASAAAAGIGIAYPEARGLILDALPSRELVSSSALQSSGSNDAFIVRIGFVAFSASAVIGLAAFWHRWAASALKWVHLANVALLLFVLWLVNLDVSVVRSIRLGDAHLLGGILLGACPLPLLWRAPRPRKEPSAR